MYNERREGDKAGGTEGGKERREEGRKGGKGKEEKKKRKRRKKVFVKTKSLRKRRIHLKGGNERHYLGLSTELLVINNM